MKSLIAALVLALSIPVQARIIPASNTLAQTAPDAWSVFGGGCPQSPSGSGPTGCETAVDYNGNLVPTVTNVQTLGSSTLGWKEVFVGNNAAGTNMGYLGAQAASGIAALNLG